MCTGFWRPLGRLGNRLSIVSQFKSKLWAGRGHSLRSGSGHNCGQLGAAELVVDLGGIVDMATINGPDEPFFSGGAMATLRALTVAFPATVPRGDYP